MNQQLATTKRARPLNNVGCAATVAVRISEQDLAAFDEIAERRGISRSTLLREAVRNLNEAANQAA